MNATTAQTEHPFNYAQNVTPEQAAFLEVYAAEKQWDFVIEPAVEKLLFCQGEMVFKIFYSDPAFGTDLGQKLFRVLENAYNPPKKLAKAYHVGNNFFIIYEIGGLYAALDHFFSDAEFCEGLERPEDGEVTIDSYPALIHIYVGDRDCVYVADVPMDDISKFMKA